MIDYSEIRSALADGLAGKVNGVRAVSRGAVSGPGAFPLIIIGQPETEFTGATFCLEKSELPVAVAVGRDGTNDQAVIDQLDQLAVGLVAALRQVLAEDPALGGACGEAHLTRIEPGSLIVQGIEHPCHTAWLEIHG